MEKITALKHLRSSLEASKRFVLGLVGDITGTVADALEELDGTKVDKTNAVAVTIPASGWGSDNNAAYPYYYDIAVSGVTAADRADVAVSPGSLEMAKGCGLCPASETLVGKVRIRASAVPAAAITAEYWIVKGKE